MPATSPQPTPQKPSLPRVPLEDVTPHRQTPPSWNRFLSSRKQSPSTTTPGTAASTPINSGGSPFPDQWPDDTRYSSSSSSRFPSPRPDDRSYSSVELQDEPPRAVLFEVEPSPSKFKGQQQPPPPSSMQRVESYPLPRDGHSRSASFQMKKRSRRHSLSRLEDTLHLEASTRRRKRHPSPNLSLDQSISSDDSSYSPARSLSFKHRRSLSLQSEAAEMWVKPLTRLARMRGMVWLLCLVGLTSVSMTVITNRTIIAPVEQVVTRPRIQVKRSQVAIRPAAGLRGKLLAVNSNKPNIEKQHHPDSTSPREEHKHGDKHNGKKKKHSDSGEHGALKHHEKSEPRHEKKEPHHTSIQHHEQEGEHGKKSINEIHNKGGKHSAHKAITKRGLPAVVLPHSKDTKQRFESLDRHLYGTSSRHSNDASKRVVFLDDSMSRSPPKHRKIALYPSDFTDKTQLYSILDSNDERVKGMEPRKPLVQGECVPMQEWQTTFHPSCNGVHELGLEHLGEDNGDHFHLFGTKGYWRNAWQVNVHGGQAAEKDTIVLKTLKIVHRFEEAHFEHDRIDAVAMERLTSSPHVINVFGFCGHSVMTEYADGKRLGELADKSRKTPLARLKIARDIATGLADVHGIDGDGNATFVHLDINPANVVSIGGTLKLNDFNIGIVRRWNTTSNTPCGFPAQYPNPQWRSPEEARDEQNLTEKVDIFSMGHIFFRLICGHEPWNKLEPNGKPSKTEVNEKVKKGELPTIPMEVIESTDPEVTAIREAMFRCYTFDPLDRPSAREIAKTLQAALDKLESAALEIV